MNLKSFFKLEKISIEFKGRNFVYKIINTSDNHRIIGISGKSGSGKSVLLYYLAGFINNEIKINAAYSDSNSFFLFSNVLNNFDIRDNNFVSLYTSLFDEEISFFSNMNITDCSFGQQIRFKLIRLFLSRKSVLLLDEPTNGLDTISAQKVINVLNRYSIEKLIFIASHDKEVLDICDTIIEI